jgi:hypothetical protein
VTGWAHGGGNVVVEAWINGSRVASCRPSERRVDVAATFPERRGTLNSGYSLDLPAGAIADDELASIQILARPSLPLFRTTVLGAFQAAGPGFLRKLAQAPAATVTSPFPADVTALVEAVSPEDCTDLGSEHGQRRFVKCLQRLFATAGVNSEPRLAGYSRFLTHTLAHCNFVAKHFPAFNPAAREGSADFNCKPNSIRELFPIIHHLYVLRSYGVEGDFAEFGCFKGYSSAMLSFACHQLGLKMHIFDSFQGLPAAEDAGYEAGQYAGSLDEVKANVARFGAIDATTFHEGFFSESLKRWRPDKLLCLWMDVDLESSARDLMVVGDAVDPRGAIFSHECTADVFRDGRVESTPRPDNPIAPMLETFEALGRPMTGHYVSGFTGAFWAKDTGIPVLGTAPLFDLASALF